ncbi:GLPGLI family protein [Chryseobacterium tongliaoense]|uniref:GLPGLI family protein n=1 Tax=Chryseobacterium tongliaoense TaxID=3240933 RepID=UPI003511EC86
MKKIFQFLGIALIGIANAQSSGNRFFYELTYKPHKDSVKFEKEMMILDIEDKRSVYQSYELVMIDSISNKMILNAQKTDVMLDFNKIPVSKIKFTHRIFKSLPVKEIIYSDQIFSNTYYYHEIPELIWQINNEKEKIGTYDTQKAFLNYGGRKWTAWFTTEIPIQDGPYKFYGLPGLIVKIEDEGKNYSWELKGNRKIDHMQDVLYLDKLNKQTGINKSKELSKEKFTELYENYKKDPFADIRRMASQLPADIKMPDGSSITESMREANKKLKEELNRTNNSIEVNFKNK